MGQMCINSMQYRFGILLHTIKEISMKKIFLSLVIIIFPLYIHATPVITNITGTQINGQTITITGTNLYNTSGGSKPTAAPLITSYDNATSAKNWHGGSAGSGWSFRNNTVMATASPRTALYQSDHYANCPYDGSYNDIAYDDPSGTDTDFYVSVWYDVSAASMTLAGSGGNTKNLRYYSCSGGGDCSIQTTFAADSSDGGPWTTFMTSDDGTTGDNSQIVYVDPSDIPVRNWFHEEWRFRAGFSAGTVTQLRLILNGQNFGMLGNKYFSSHAHDVNYWRFGMISGNNTAGGSIYVDQIYIDNTQAHVFISNRSNITDWQAYSSTAHTEIQVPSAWSATEAIITLNQGTCTNFSTDCRYLYVVDSAGAISNAYDLTSGEGDSTAPSVTADDTTKAVSTDAYTAEGDATDAVGVDGCKWRMTSAPDANNGTACTGTTAWSCSTSGYSSGSNTLYVGCYDAAGNYGTDTVTVTYTPPATVGYSGSGTMNLH